LQVICGSGNTLVMLYQIVGEKVALSKCHFSAISWGRLSQRSCHRHCPVSALYRRAPVRRVI